MDCGDMSDLRSHLAWSWTGNLGRWGGLQEEAFCPGTGQPSDSHSSTTHGEQVGLQAQVGAECWGGCQTGQMELAIRVGTLGPG